MTQPRAGSGRPLMVQVITTLGGGGAERELARFARVLNDNGPFEVVVCCIMGRGGFADEVEQAGVEVDVLHEGKRPPPVMAMSLLSFLRSRRPVIVHSHMVSWVPIVAKLAGVPAVVLSEHGLVEWRSAIGVFVDVVNNAFADKVVAVAEAVRKYRIERWKTPAAKVVTIPNAVETFPLLDDAAISAKKGSLGVSLQSPVIGMVGRLEPIKGWNYFLDSAALIVKDDPSCHVLIVGDGPVRGELEEQIRSLHLTENVHMLGFRDDVRELMQVMDVVCLSSLTEGTPITILEAMSCRRAVVVTDVGGCADVVRHGETGLVVPPREPVAFAAAVKDILSDSALAERMGDAGLSRVREVYSIETNLKMWLEIYSEALASKGRSIV